MEVRIMSLILWKCIAVEMVCTRCFFPGYQLDGPQNCILDEKTNQQAVMSIDSTACVQCISPILLGIEPVRSRLGEVTNCVQHL
jgi:hypothetical protein